MLKLQKEQLLALVAFWYSRAVRSDYCQERTASLCGAVEQASRQACVMP